jgi:hypothetical protein
MTHRNSRNCALRAAALASLALPALAFALWTEPAAQPAAWPRPAQTPSPSEIAPRAVAVPEATRAALAFHAGETPPIEVSLAEELPAPRSIERAPLESASIRPVAASELPLEVRVRLESRLSRALAESPRPEPLKALEREAAPKGLQRPLGEGRRIEMGLPAWAAPADLPRP